MLTLLKQARAYGLGVLLATQNPVDLDYKGLANAGTWFIGRLQTEGDKKRVLDGLEGASLAAGADLDRRKLDGVLSGLGKRVFLMHNVHEDAPVIFHTRWAMSYLRGPLTTAQIGDLMQTRRHAVASTADAGPTAPVAAPQPAPGAPPTAAQAPATAPGRPEVHENTEQLFLPITGAHGPQDRVVYRPALVGVTDLHYASAKHELDLWRTVTALADLPDEGMPADWPAARFIESAELELLREPTCPPPNSAHCMRSLRQTCLRKLAEATEGLPLRGSPADAPLLRSAQCPV